MDYNNEYIARNTVRNDETGCLEWTANKDPNGYGRVFIGRHGYGNGQRILFAHRIAYSLAHPDEDISGLCVCHSCDNPACVEVDHLFSGTDGDNMADKVGKGRQNARKNLTPEDVRQIRSMGVMDAHRRFGIPRSTASNIKRRKLYASVE